MSADDKIIRYLCEKVIEEAKKIVNKGYNAEIVCDDPDLREKYERRKRKRDSACG